MENEKKNKKQGIISVKLSTGWEPWGIGTLMDGVAAQRDSGATAFAFCPLTLRKGKKARAAVIEEKQNKPTLKRVF